MLGGLLSFANAVKGPHENLEDFRKYLVRQQELKNVKVVLDTEVTSEMIKKEAPDAVILAVGGARPTLGPVSYTHLRAVPHLFRAERWRCADPPGCSNRDKSIASPAAR